MFHLCTLPMWLPVCFDLPLRFMRFTCEFHLIARSSARSHERNEIHFIENETFGRKCACLCGLPVYS